MGYLGRRIGKAQDQGDSNPAGADGAVGGGILDLFANGYFERQGNIYNAPGAGAPDYTVASGGIINDYTSGSDVYRSHTFVSSGAFQVESVGVDGTVDLLVVGGGGGGGSNIAAGGGAGGMRSFSSVPLTAGSFPVVMGAGGAKDIDLSLIHISEPTRP